MLFLHFDLLDDIRRHLLYSDEAHEACDKLRSRLEKLHFYEYVYFNRRDSDDARRIKPCMNDKREFLKLAITEDDCHSIGCFPPFC